METSKKQQNLTHGMLAVLGIWISNIVIVPWVLWLNMFTPMELMMVRGALTALVAIIWAKTSGLTIGKPDRHLVVACLCISASFVCFYESVTYVSPNFPVITFTLTPAVNMYLQHRRGEFIPKSSFVCAAIILFGVLLCVALQVEQKVADEPVRVVTTGEFAFGILCGFLVPLLDGFGYDAIGQIEGKTGQAVNSCQQTLWVATILMLVSGVVATIKVGGIPLASQDWTPNLIGNVLGFAVVAGVIYLFANVVLFRALESDFASIMSVTENPVALIAHGILIANATLTYGQWLGVTIAIGAAIARILFERRDKAKNATPNVPPLPT
jgi:hypothetical protein